MYASSVTYPGKNKAISTALLLWKQELCSIAIADEVHGAARMGAGFGKTRQERHGKTSGSGYKKTKVQSEIYH